MSESTLREREKGDLNRVFLIRLGLGASLALSQKLDRENPTTNEAIRPFFSKLFLSILFLPAMAFRT